MATNKKSGGVRTLPKSLLRFYMKYVGRWYWWLIGIWAVLTLVRQFNGVLQPLIQGWVVAIFETPTPVGQTLLEYALPTIILITVLNMIVTTCGVLSGWLTSHWGPNVYRHFSEALTDYVHGQSMGFWVGRMAGSVQSQMGQIASGFDVLELVWRSICRVLILFVNGTLLFSVNKWVAWAIIGMLVLRVIYSVFLTKPLKQAAKARASVISKLSGKIVDSISNYSLVKLFARRKFEETEHLAPTRTERIKAVQRYRYCERWFFFAPGLMYDLLFGAVILLCVFLYSRGEVTVAGIVMTISVFFHMIGAISMLIDVIPIAIDKWSTATRAYEELVKPIEVSDAENAPDLIVMHGRVEFKNVSFKYRRKWVLQDLNLIIKPGERVGIVGPSGAGKTTLVNLLMRFWDPTRGEILIDGQNIRDVGQDSLRENIAFIPQDPTMFNRSLRENIAYGRVDATDADIRRAARRASAHKFIMDTEKKYDSLVGDRGIKLSGGQRQRVAIARAFLKDAPILVLDEATSALDSETELAIQESFDELAAGRTTIAIAHRLSTLRNMDRIIVIKDGRVIEQGRHTTLVRKNGEYARLWKMQSGGFIQE